MKNKYNELTCLFGHHQYSDRFTYDRDWHPIYLCKICKRSGYRKYSEYEEIWYDYDEEGRITYVKSGHGYEYWYEYNKQGILAHEKWNTGEEFWFNVAGDMVRKKYADGRTIWRANNGRWIDRIPKNWKHEKDI